MAEFNKAQPLSPVELMQLRLRIIRAIARVRGTPAAQSQALDDMLRLVATVDHLDERLKAAEAKAGSLDTCLTVLDRKIEELEAERNAYRLRAEELERERDAATGYARMRLAEDIEAARKVDDA